MAKWIVFHVTERCGLECLHCLRDPGRQPADIPLAVVEKALDEAARLHGVSHAGLTGGDPSLHPQFEEIIDAVVRRDFTWHMVTSGRRFDRTLALLDAAPARRAALSAIDVSLDGADAATHDTIRAAGSWREAMQAMAACKARDIRFTAQMTVNALNQAELERVGLLAAELGAASVSFGMTHATGRPDDARLYLAPEAVDAVYDRVERLAGVLRIPVSAAVGFRRPERFQVCEPFRSEVLHVDPLGRLNLCCNHSGVGGCRDDVVGDLAQVSLAEAHRGLLRLVHRLELEQLEALEAGQATGWDAFPCNACLKRLGKPHWTGGGSAGPRIAGAAAES